MTKNAYDAGKFGVVNRQWFFLKYKNGGSAATGFELYGATKGGTKKTVVTRWYPKGPIQFMKFGALVQATYTNASSDLHRARLVTRGASASAGVTLTVKSTSTAKAAYTIASAVSFTTNHCRAGEYVSINMATPVTDKGTGIAATTTGTLAFFIDWRPKYDVTQIDKWDT